MAELSQRIRDGLIKRGEKLPTESAIMEEQGVSRTVVREALRMFIQHGARYSFPATRGEMTRGMPTSYAAAPLKDLIMQPNEPPPVWPHKAGSVRGAAFYPLYPTVPDAAARNPALYELLVLFDAVRGGSPRERAIALQVLDERLAS